ncbi:radiation sensitive protein rad9, partial [Cryomyces antarcticus]
MTAFDETPSQTGMYHVSFGRLPMFAGAGGDTQPDSQIYKNYSSMIKSQDAPDNSLDTPGRTTADTDGPRTYTDGDAGHVNLIEHWEASLPGDEKPTLDEGSEDELGSSSPQVRIDLPHESMRMPPKTPTTAGQKRNYRGEIISSTTTKTPGSGLATFFGHGVLGPAMSLTQMFNATQAPSSPLPVGFRSDPVFDRPSPNFAHHHSSPVAAMSSLAKDGRPDLPRTGIEPRDTYISMKESQERRARRKRQEQEQRMKSALQGHGDGGSDEESDSAEQKVARRMQRAQISTEAMRAWSGVTAPPRRHGRQTLASASTATGYVTPARSIRRRRENREIVEISDDIPAVDATSEAESVDEYDELAQTIRQSQSQPGNLRSDGIQVPMTASRAAGHPLEPDDDAHSPSVNQGIAEGLPLNTGKDVVSAADSPQISGSSPKPSATTRDMQLVAVADSQLQNAGTQQSLPPPRPVEPSSMQSLVPASQIASLSPETRVRVDATILSSIDTSSIPLHPTDTSQLVEDVVEERLPSSPPLLAPSVFPNGDGKENVSGSEDELNLIST